MAAALTFPALLGLLLAGWLLWLNSTRIDPASVAALGVLVSLVAATLTALTTARTPLTSRKRAVVGISLGGVAVLVAWVIANRLAGVPMSTFRPSGLLSVGVACAALSLAVVRWDQELAAGLRRLRGWYAVYAARAGVVDTGIVALVAVAFRAAVMFRMPAVVIGDSGVLLETVTTILDQFSFAPLTVVFPPAYPLFLAAVSVLVGPDFLAVAAVQHVLGVGTALCTYWLGRTFLPPLLALLPALGVAANGYLIILEHGIYSEALFIPLAVLFALTAVRLLHGGGPWTAAAAGATLALAALTRLVIQPALLAVVFLLPLYQGWRRALPRLLIFASAFVVVVSPWVAHNRIHYGYVGLSNSLGMQLLPRLWEEEGSYQWSDSGETDPVLRRALAALQHDKDRGVSWWEAWLRIERDFPERDTSALVTAAVLDVIGRQPDVYLSRTWFRLNRMWRGGFTKERVHDLYGQQDRLGIHSPIFKVRAEAEFSALAEREGNKADAITRVFRPDVLPAWLTLALTALAAAGALVSRRLRPALVPLGLGLGLLVLPVVLNADRARYLHPAEPFLLLTYAAGSWALIRGLAWARVSLSRRVVRRAAPRASPWAASPVSNRLL